MRSIVRVGGGAPATTMRTRSLAGDRAVPGRGRVEHRGGDCGRAAHQRHAVPLDPPQDLGAVDLAQHDVRPAHPGDRVGHAPSVAVEHRERVEVHVAIGDAALPSERGRVDPDVAVRELHALGTRGRATRVVDGGGRVFVGLAPGLRFHAFDAGARRRSRHRSRSGAWPSRRGARRRARGRRAAPRHRSARRCSPPPRRSGGS